MSRFPSWPGLSRPSTFFLPQDCKDVDARHKAGHDELEANARIDRFWIQTLSIARRCVPG
jgi:hypothetical protein